MAKNARKGKQPKRTGSKPAAVEPASVPVTYDLFELPTAQHKAGLAGLLLQIESMRNRKKPAPAYRWDDKQPATKVHIDFTRETVEELFTDAYPATVDKAWFRQQKKKEQLLDERPPETPGGVKKYLYEVVRPTLPALHHYLGTSETAGCWLSLWHRAGALQAIVG